MLKYILIFASFLILNIQAYKKDDLATVLFQILNNKTVNAIGFDLSNVDFSFYLTNKFAKSNSFDNANFANADISNSNFRGFILKNIQVNINTVMDGIKNDHNLHILKTMKLCCLTKEEKDKKTSSEKEEESRLSKLFQKKPDIIDFEVDQ